MAWTEQQTEQLKKLWAEGHTASQIARMLGENISRNAVIGKAHRLNLQGRTQSRMISSPRINNTHYQQNKVAGQKRIRRPRGLRAIVIEKDFYFCGRSPMEDRIYCKLHVLHAYQPRGQRAEEPAKTNEEIPSFIQKKVKSA